MLLALALLEVMDKEPGVLALWLSGIVWAAAGHVLGHRRWWAGAGVIAIRLLALWGLWGEITDPFVGPAIQREAGPFYAWHAVGSAALVVGATGAGIVSGRRHVRRRDPAAV